MTNIAVSIPPSLSKYRSHLRLFFEGMIRKLDLNSHKSTPEREDIQTILTSLRAEIEEFEEQISRTKFDPNALTELQDASNFAFLAFVAMRNDGVLTETEVWINTYFDINPELGKVFIKKGRAGSPYKPGDELQGNLSSNGYVHMRLQSFRHSVHKVSLPRSHLIWWKATGNWPTGVIDHINRTKNDDRIKNLRDATFSENSLNKLQSDRKYPPFVMSYKPTGRQHLAHYGKFVYTRHFKGIHVRCGYYDSPEEAAEKGAVAWEQKLKEKGLI